MDLYVVVHHQHAEQVWHNRWIDSQTIDYITTTNEIGQLCRQAKERGERVYVHRCGWEECPPVICCSAEVQDVGEMDGTTSWVQFTNVTTLNLNPVQTPTQGQNYYFA